MPVSSVMTQPMASSALAAPMQWPSMLFMLEMGTRRARRRRRASTLASAASLCARAGAVRVDEVDVVGRDARALDGRAHGGDAARRVGVRPRDVVGVAREAVAADLGLDVRRPARTACASLSRTSRPAPSPRRSPWRFRSKGWHRSGAMAARRTKPLNWSSWSSSAAPRDDHVGAAGADEVRREADGVVAGGAGRREREDHALRRRWRGRRGWAGAWSRTSG